MLFDSLQRLDLKEYASNSELEGYTGIVLDKKDNVFKVVTGQFHDKKDFYEKLTARGMVVRKVFEQKVWRWMEDNAPNNLTAYLMFSTAFSKWKGNNVLGDYYVKLLNDIPQLNREKVKGDPKTMGLDKTIRTDESVLTEVGNDEYTLLTPVPNYYKDSKALKGVDIQVYPLNKNGTPSRFAEPLIKKAYVVEPSNNGKYTLKDIVDLHFWRALYSLKMIYHTGEPYPAWGLFNKFVIRIDDQAPFDITTEDIVRQYTSEYRKYRDSIAWNDENTLPTIKSASEYEISPVKVGDSDVFNGLRKAYIKAKVNGASPTALNDLKYRMKLSGKAAEKQVLPELKPIINYTMSLKQQYESTIEKINKTQAIDLSELTHALTACRADIEKRLTYPSTGSTTVKPQLEDLLIKVKSNISQMKRIANLDASQAVTALQHQLTPLKKIKNKTYEMIVPTPDAKTAMKKMAGYSNTDEVLNQRIQNMYNTQYSPSNPIHGGDMEGRFFANYDKVRDLEKQAAEKKDVVKKEESTALEEDSVNTGVTAMYQTQPIGGQPMDVYPTNRGMVPVGGLFLEQDGEIGFNPVLFDGDRLNPDVRAALLKIADKFKERLDLKLQPIDVYLTGSNSNYNYNEHSDIDLHLVYIYEEAGAAAEILARYLIAQKKIFNSDYDIRIKGIPVEVGCEDLDHPLVAGGIYSVLNDKWLMRPSELPQLHNDKLPPYINKVINEIERAIESHDSTLIGNLWKSLGALRKESLAKEGEFGAGNLMFKKLRAEGYLDRLKQAYYSSESKTLSLEALEEI